MTIQFLVGVIGRSSPCICPVIFYDPIMVNIPIFNRVSSLYLLSFAAFWSSQVIAQKTDLALLASIETSLRENIADIWYPRTIDPVYGGFLSRFDWQWNQEDDQRKGIVTQSRHVWTTIRLYERYPDREYLKTAALAGGKFIREKFWDPQNGGFYWLLERDGTPLENESSGEEIRQTYGTAFAIYALGSLYEVTGDPEMLDKAVEAFKWLENHAHDREKLGYFDLLTASGEPYFQPEKRQYAKGQNTTIHLLEAFTALYHVWPDSLLKTRILELKELLIGRIIDPRGYLVQFFGADWTPVSYLGMPKEAYLKVSYWDHVSFGHDVETAYLLWEADQVLGGEDEQRILSVGKRLLDHALEHGWDPQNGGIPDGGFYFTEQCEIVRPQKTWWAQAEMLNALLMFEEFFPEDSHHYQERALEMWYYIQTYIIDGDNGGWFELGQDLNPESRLWPKSHIWKGAYHNSRALLNARHWIDKVQSSVAD